MVVVLVLVIYFLGLALIVAARGRVVLFFSLLNSASSW